MSQFNTYLERFLGLERQAVCLERAHQIVSWDWRVMTPKAAASGRAETIGALSDLNYQLLTGRDMQQTLDYLDQPECLERMDGATRASVRAMARESRRMARIPEALFSEFSVLQSRSEAAWEQAKRTDDWELYRPHLQAMFDYTNRFIDLWGYEGSRYNALVGFEEQGMTAEKLDQLFADIRAGVVPLVKAVAESDVEIDDGFCRQAFPVDAQHRLALALLDRIGFDRKRGVLAESEHPYTTSFGPQDVRLTTHYYEDRFLPAVFSTLHEGGHGIYEQNIAQDMAGRWVGRGLHGGMHESVSRFWENMVGRSLGFWQFNMPLFQQMFPQQLGKAAPEQMYAAVNKSGRGYTRMEADELTYNLHIMLRCELEKDVFEGRAQVKDLPELWNQKMKEYLGLTPPNHTLGILQDIQWSMAQFGYFPSYTLGNLYNAQYTHAMKKELDFDRLVREGDYAAILAWKKDKLYRFGATRTPRETMLAMTGEEVDARYLVAHLREKFSAIYHL